MLGVALLSAGCALLKPPAHRLDALESASSCARPAKALVILLPGRFDTPQDLIDNGFADALRSRNIDADLVIPDLHFGYYLARSAVDRLHEDIIAPRLGRHEQIWLTGISLGGFGALLYAREHGPHDGMLLVAPYLGGRRIEAEVRRAGDLRRWDPQASLGEEYEIGLWQWVRDEGEGVPLLVGYGRGDAFAPASRALLSGLPAGSGIAVDGGHDWPAWRRVWERFLDMGRLPVC